jgi:iron complex outermembrane recepter protein
VPVSPSFQRLFASSALAAALACPGASSAGAPLAVLDIPGGPLPASLQALERQTGLQILYNPAVVAGRRAPAIRGRFSTEAALRRLVDGDGLDVIWSGPRTVGLRARSSMAFRTTTALDQPIATAQADAPETRGSGTASPPAAAVRPGSLTKGAQPLTATGAAAEVVVTGTHIRGVQANASPLVQVTRTDLERLGDATVADALQRLPQNFAGTANPLTVQIGSDRSGTNGIYSQGLNLRGLGANATLVLLNGRRLAGTGVMGDVADVSAIPTAAVDHVDVLLDGASAIYGSDAVGGVVNIVTRSDFKGSETLARYGQDEGGVGDLLQVSETAGTAWDGGHLMAAYQHQHDGALPASARRYTANSDLTALGGSNWDAIESSPGNILAFNAAKGAYVSAYALPTGTGLGLTSGSLAAGATNYQNIREDTDLTPNQDSDGVYLSAGQKLDSKTELTFDGRFNLRTFDVRQIAGETILSVTNKNPYFVSPNGATSELIGYSAVDAIGPYRDNGESRSYDAAIGLNRELSGGWRLVSDVDLAGEHGTRTATDELNSSHLSEALGSVPDDPTTAFSTAADGYFNPYGSANSKAVLAFISGGYSRESDDDQVFTADLQVDGTVLRLPGGDVKAAFGGQYRHERAEFSTLSVTSSSPFSTGGMPYARDIAAAFGELNIPLVGAANAVPGVRALSLSVAGRVEHYDDVGTTANPKVGLIWTPVRDLTLHASYGTSFRAPALYELHDNATIAPSMVPSAAGTTLSLIEYGGNADLKPETATSWTAGGDWTPRQIPGLRLGATWFDIDYTNRIDDPGSSALTTILIDPAYATLVQRVNGGNAGDLAEVNALLSQASGASAKLYPASAYGAIIDARYLNVASLLVSGVDLNASYGRSFGRNRLTLTGSATDLYAYKQKTTPDGRFEELVSTASRPVDWRMRTTLDWSRAAYDAAVTVNFVDSYRDTVNARTIGSWTTLDATVTWRSPAVTGPAQGLVATAALQNLLDTDPPFYNAAYGVGFDAANATPLGRVWSVQVSKRF